MRNLVLILNLIVPWSALAQEGEFGGAWSATLCAEGAQRKAGECSTFVLEILERDGKLCGSHMFATPGARRIDEGAAPSLTADIVARTASGVAVSSMAGSPVRMRFELKLDGRRLHWERLENPPGEYLLPRQASLTRASQQTLLAPLFAQELRAACNYIFNLPAAGQAEPIPGSAGAGVPAR